MGLHMPTICRLLQLSPEGAKARAAAGDALLLYFEPLDDGSDS